MITQRLRERFEDKFIPEPNSGCWLWIAGLGRGGYGKFSIGGTMLAHRASWVLHRGEIPEGMNVLHKCDVRPCVNPDHLYLGDARDNAQDMWAKGRAAHLKGESHGCAKLTDGQVYEIRADGRTLIKIAASYGVSEATICLIKQQRLWKHVATEAVEAPRGRNGERHHDAKITEQQVREIRADPRSQTKIARAYGIGPTTVWAIKHRKTWKHVDV